MTRSIAAALAAFAIGTPLAVLVDHPAALAAGIVLVVAVVPLGLWGIATPAFLGRDRNEDEG